MRSAAFPDCRAFAEINGRALCRNYRLLHQLARKTNPSARLIAVVKDDAYGHGLLQTVPLLLAAGCDFFAVATAAEAFGVRGLSPTADILVLGYTPPRLAPDLAAARITQTVFDADYGAALSDAMSSVGQKLFIHTKINGGLCRGGLAPTEREALCRLLSLPHLAPTGIYTHFPVADTDPAATRRALADFLGAVQAARQRGHSLFIHAAASAAALTLPEATLDGIRAGIALYGLPPVETPLPLSPVLSLHAPVICLSRVPSGTPVGYGGSFVTGRETVLGTLPIGYGDGFWRCLRPLSVTLSHGGQAFSVPIAGRICMDHTVVDLTDTPAAIGDTVCLWQSAKAPAAEADTIPYEILTALCARVERRIVSKPLAKEPL